MSGGGQVCAEDVLPTDFVSAPFFGARGFKSVSKISDTA
jgi:hypothetical protein